MKGFKPTGYGMRAGFQYPSSMGFTTSTGRLTNVSGYTRRKGFASGGFVREDNPRIKESSPGDEGSALQKRNKPSNNLDQESGGKTPLRPGFKKGGRTMKGMKKSGGALQKAMCKAGGGRVIPRGSSAKSFSESVKDVPKLFKEIIRSGVSSATGLGGGMANKAGKLVSGRTRYIDRTVDEASTGSRANYRKGGRTKARR